MTGIEPELWVGRAASAVAFYEAAFGATTLLRVGEGEDVVARLEVDGVRFWVASADGDTRLDPLSAGGRTGRTLLVVDDPDAVVTTAVAAGATLTSAVGEEHDWRVGRIFDPFGHEWEIGRPDQSAGQIAAEPHADVG